jgi:transcriptional regulator with PAS, ATPase and Fis domain
MLTRVATSPSSILICSESGTGKEVVARAIHQLSGRANKPFVAINCAAIPDGLQESELFGYTKGSFTNASTTGKSGLIQSADHGTLFLDEIGDMSLSTQAKLLRVIETREVQPIGASKSIPIDIRIVAATHQNLQHRIAEGKFREDLYYRINVIPMTIPPLRERGGDIELLVHHYLNLHARRLGAVYPGISPAVLKLLPQYSWPGNVRELSNLMEYLVNVVPDGEVIDERLLPPSIAKGLLSEASVSHGTKHGSLATAQRG